jgi:putative selenium metabolism hydrolase
LITDDSRIAEELVKYCGGLIKIESLSGNEGKLVEYLKSVFTTLSFDEIAVDKYGSITATLRGANPGPALLFDAHIDTVPVADKSVWTKDPFGGEFSNGKIYGRGASDMKGALASMIVAARLFKQKPTFYGSLTIAGVVHEECFEGIAAREISKNIRPDYVIIGEASELNLKCGQRGRAEIVVETFGKQAHSANPRHGVNAVYKMADLVSELAKLAPPKHPALGKGILELTDIISAPYPGASVIPDYCRATYDRRLLKGETAESVLDPINKLINNRKKNDPSFSAKASIAEASLDCYTGSKISGKRFFPGWLFDETEGFIQASFSALQKAGLTPKITQYSFCTNGSHYAGEAGIKTIGFGPSQEKLAHTVNEHIELSELQGACAGYYELMNTFLSGLPSSRTK